MAVFRRLDQVSPGRDNERPRGWRPAPPRDSPACRAPVPNRFRLFLLLIWLRYGPGVEPRVQAALLRSASDTGSDETIATVTALRLLVQRAARWVPGSRCLDQALATWIVAQRMGLPAALRLGVRRQAGLISAHAWISVGTEAIGEDPDALRQLLPLQQGGLNEIERFD